MARQTDEAQDFYAAVYEAVQRIPYGRVTSYGHIAYLIGKPKCPRQVGNCLKHLPSRSPNDDENAANSAASHQYHAGNVPWQRVINSQGIISPRGPDGARHQAEALTNEGVVVETGDLGEFWVDLATYGWFPEVTDDDGESVR